MQKLSIRMSEDYKLHIWKKKIQVVNRNMIEEIKWIISTEGNCPLYIPTTSVLKIPLWLFC